MGVITHIASEFDEDEQVQRVFAVTKFGVSTRSALNRVASRASTTTGAGQRTLVASAYDELGLDLVWRDGPLGVVPPEEKWPEAQEIEFHEVSIDRASDFGDITNIPTTGDTIPRGKISDLLLEGIDSFRPEQVMYVWEIPYGVGGRDI